ncbi:hypothetical protein BN8_00154 [Fibrisoma limi BUZ 3]|uniref:DUF4833 domain-containing protein n=1 Tax=Fibrisoma limi BUZ 3 TaxID=1185876 RepID=I2GBG5_9BACT|nr:DUF4833 domain-containing protein [Fibrisoma limi]CCH51239.1 hypothetical protein BN8_00154 [Fibrisoma limi BUZ 3]
MNSTPIPFLTLLIALLLQGILPVQAARGDSFPSPPTSTNRLFYIQRSKDANTIVYDANLTADGKLDARKPIQVYWIRYADRGQREDLSSVQWHMAYGYKHSPVPNASDAFDVTLNAFRKRPVIVAYRQGKPVAMTIINGQLACLQKVFVQVSPGSGLIPKIHYVDMFGIDPDKGQPVHERINF